MLPSMKINALLLWGAFVLFAVESTSTSTPENRTTNIAVETNYATMRTTTAEVLQPATWNSMHKHEDVSPAVEKSVSQTNATEKSEEATTRVTTVTTATTEAQPAPVEATTRVTTVTTATTEAQPAPVEATTRVTTVTKTATGVQPSTSMTTTVGAQSPHYTTGAFNQTSDQPHLSSASISTYKTTPETTPATHAATVAVSSQQPPFVTGITSEKPSTTSSNVTTQNVSTFIQNISSPTSSSPTPEKATTYLSSVSQSVSIINTLPSTTSETARPTSATTESPSSTNSTSPVGILVPRKPKRLPIPTAKPAPATTANPCETTKNSPSIEFQTCSTRGVAKQCLIVIAILAGLTTIFMLSTIVLCVKLSARKPKAKKQQATEMMCISSLLPERTRTYTRHRNPISNGVLVLPGYGDSDEEGADNVTLSSFLPENDRYV
uniref:Mucin 12, cell surface associated n=1 Tax=Iconisemion striatum TaxID=60296 RepID=A0A1A7XV61_9TELE